MKFNMLTVLEKAPLRSANGAVKWTCQCECGAMVDRESQQLRNGYAFSCGCITRRMRDAVGKRFGRLVVMKNAGTTKRKSQIVSCLCDCGNTHNVVLSALVQNLVVSCGCFHSESVAKRNKDTALSEGVASFNSLLYRYKSNASKKQLDWQLSAQQFAELTQRNCHYCDSKPQQVITAHGCNSPYTYNGIDRINSSLGYLFENCVPACKKCNFAKNNMSTQEFSTMIEKIYNHWVKNGI